MVGYVAFQFSVSNQLAGFSDDSATYLIMAMVFSPFQDVSINILNSYHHYYLPPGFPLILSIFDGGNNIYISHCVVLSQVLLSCMLFFYLCKNTVGAFQAFLALLMFIFMPGFWIQMLKLMSEYQYIVLSLGFIFLVNATDNNFCKRTDIAISIGMILSLCILTRSIGISLAIAYAIFALLNSYLKTNPKEIIGVFVGLFLPLLIWKFIQPAKSHLYIHDVFSFMGSNTPVTSLINTIFTNILALYKGITINLSLISAGNSYVVVLMIFLVGFALTGLMMRIKNIDGLYLLLYILVYSQNIPSLIYISIMLLLTVPSLTHIVKRYKLGTNQYGENVSSIIELYEIKNETRAITTSLIWKKNIEVFKSLKTSFDKNDKILTVKPHLFTYLSGIYAEELPRITGKMPNENFFRQWMTYIDKSNATHLVLLTIELSPGLDEIDIMPQLSDSTEKILSYSYIYDNKEQTTLAILRLL
jgi:competence protein ComGC